MPRSLSGNLIPGQQRDTFGINRVQFLIPAKHGEARSDRVTKPHES